MQKHLPFIIRVALLLFTRKLHCLQTFRQVIAHLDPTCVQNFRPVALTVFEMLGLKLNKKKKKKNWRNGLLPYLPC